MSQPFIGQIVIFGFTFPPNGWALCNGQLLSIAQNTALFSILGTTYGGDGVTTFALPNLQGRGAFNFGQGPGLSNYVLGEQDGVSTVTLTEQQLPAHTHVLNGALLNPANAAQTVAVPTTTAMVGSSAPGPAYSVANTPAVAMNPAAITSTGGSQPHDNMQPYLALNFSIALFGIFPSRN